jgi:hypothetical protein
MACKTTQDHSILDMAPTICKAFDLNAEQMEGKSLLRYEINENSQMLL